MRHKPVLVNEVVELLNLKSGMKVVDGTLGDAGHSELILEKILPNGKLLGIDMDPEAILRAKKFLESSEENVVLVRDNFSNFSKILEKEVFKEVDAILFDLGWSSPQFEERGRGFSFQKDELLDMRFGGNAQDHENSETAADILNNASFEELEKIFREYGEERFAKDIAKVVIEKRRKEKFSKTGQLVEIAMDIYKKKGSREKIHPATRILQALRIAVNDEIRILKDVLPQAVENLKTGGRLAVISFHSLEDRVVKHFFKSQQNKLKIITKKPVSPGQEELNENRRARSAKLRVAEKI
ncbi:MAG: 16S rRNA (cytosine(1402)-N(4))-methyltransferase RsmH [Candidatus Magasanikbacteria bacterium]|nr:16S rRNA (cytosine(1402)-N(4))-methyltransferase RsmH [Candidatus Magasanikbacteria bacterium]